MISFLDLQWEQVVVSLAPLGGPWEEEEEEDFSVKPPRARPGGQGCLVLLEEDWGPGPRVDCFKAHRVSCVCVCVCVLRTVS